MGDPKGFLKFKREASGYRPVCERKKDYRDVVVPRDEEKSVEQAARCMDCGTPFCNWGCPLGNYIPEWNDHVYRERDEGAYRLLASTNSLPEITGRVCPAPCEHACVLGINDKPVTIRDNELYIIENAFKKSFVRPVTNKLRTGKKAAVVGSGPAGISAAAALVRMGHDVTLFERDEKPGGILRYGIPDFKLEKSIIDRRMNILAAEGVKIRTGVDVGKDYAAGELLNDFDAILLAVGCRTPREFSIPGRELSGIYRAMDYLSQSNRRVDGAEIDDDELIDAENKRVLVIGGGDTGSDCVGTANRQGASCVMQVEIMPEPPKERPPDQPWPEYPFVFKTSSSHEEGVERKWSVMTKQFRGENNRVKSIECVKCEPAGGDKPGFKECAGTEFEIEADMVILAMGFTEPEKKGLLNSLNLKTTARGNIERDEKGRTSMRKIFAAGDSARGPSLVVWAIAEGRRAAEGMNEFLLEEDL